MITAIIIDDEEHCINRLSGLLHTAFADSIQLQGAYLTYDTGLEAIKKLQPNLVFLDVQLHGRSGIDLLEELGNIPFQVIFTTAYEQYAIQAFRFSAIDYLLKPVEGIDLGKAIHKLTEKLSQADLSARFDTLFHNLRNITGVSKRICVPVQSGFEFIQVSDIIRCQGEVNYTTIFMKDKLKLVVAKTLKEFEQLLQEYGFFRVHNSHLINLLQVKRYNKGKGGTVTLLDHSVVEVSTRRKDEFLKKIASL